MPKVQSLKPGAVPARVAALRMLARRELSEAQVRQRLQRRGYAHDEIESAIVRLKSERAIDDVRVAGAIARTETSLKRRGRLRVAQELARKGIPRTAADKALDETFADLDADQLMETALSKRLRNRRPIADDKEFRRLYRYLVAQGFESDHVFAALSKRRRTT